MRESRGSRAIVPLLGAALLAAVARPLLAQDQPDGVGTLTPSGSKFTTEIDPANDVDDYVFQGFPGMKVTATAKAGNRSGLVPAMQVFRADGSMMGDDSTLSLRASAKSATAKFTVDASGWWKVRVLGAGSTQGEYAVSVKYGKPRVPPLPVVTKSFKSAASISPAGDLDEFSFQGFAGQAFLATLVVSKRSTLDPQLQLIAPDGVVLNTTGAGSRETKLVVARHAEPERSLASARRRRGDRRG